MKNFLVFLLSPAFIFFIYDIIFYWSWTPFYEYSEGVLYSLSLFSILNFFLLIRIVKFSRKEISWQANSSQKSGKNLNIFIVFFLILIGVFALYMQLGGNLNLDLQEKYSEVNSEGIFYIVVVQIITYTLIYDLYIGQQKPFIFFVVLLFVMLSALTGGRSGVIWTSLLIFFMASAKFNLKWIYLILTLTLILLFFILTSVLRGTINFDGGGDAIGYLDFNQIFTFEETMRYTTQYGSQFGKFLGDVADGFLPRSINPDKKTSTAFTREVFPEVWERTSYTSGFYANLVFVFGYVGLFVAPLLLVGMNVLYMKAINGFGKNKINFLILFFSLFPLLLVRGGLFEFRVVFAFFLICFAILLHSIIKTKIF